MAYSPTQLSLKKLRADGYIAEVVEKWIPGANIRKDLFGFIDIVAIRDGETLGVQTTSKSNMSARIRKIEDSDFISAIRKANWTIKVHGWHKADNRWVCAVKNVS
jgi:hypothetical protein